MLLCDYSWPPFLTIRCCFCCSLNTFGWTLSVLSASNKGFVPTRFRNAKQQTYSTALVLHNMEEVTFTGCQRGTLFCVSPSGALVAFIRGSVQLVVVQADQPFGSPRRRRG
jgi:hypothetical protein